MRAFPRALRPASPWGAEIAMRLRPHWIFIGLIAGLLASTASAQIELALRLPHQVILRGESLDAVVSVTNLTGHPLMLDDTNGYSFSVEVRDLHGARIFARNDKRLPEAPRVLETGGTSFTNDLTTYYDMTDAGQVSVAARIDMGGISYYSRKFFLDINPGSEIESLQTMVGDTLVNLRLMLLNRDGHESVLLEMTDKEGRKLIPARDLGTIIRLHPPQMKLDANRRLHILHFSGPRQFFHHIVGLDGVVIKKEMFTGNYRSADLEATADGVVTVDAVQGKKSEDTDVMRQRPLDPKLHR